MLRSMTETEGEDPLERAMTMIAESEDAEGKFDEEGFAVTPRSLAEANSTRSLSEDAKSKKGCEKCCQKCNCGGCQKGSKAPGRAFPSEDGKKTVVVYDEKYASYKKRVSSCKPPPVPEKCVMKMVIHHLTNEIEVCKECISHKKDKKEVLYHHCKGKKHVIPVKPIFKPGPGPHPPTPAKWHQVCTCTWVRNGPNYKGPTHVRKENEKSAEARKEAHKQYLAKLKDYKKKVEEYKQKKKDYAEEKKKYEAAKKRAAEVARHEAAAARIFNRKNKQILAKRAKEMMEKGEHNHRAPLRVLCPCNNAGARSLSMHETQMPAIREAAQVTFGAHAEHMLTNSVVAPEE